MKLLITFLAALFLSTSALAQENEVYTYLTVIQQGNDLKIGYGDGEFEVTSVKGERTGDILDHRPILKRISAFEKEGWEMVSTEIFYSKSGYDMIVYALMRKEI